MAEEKEYKSSTTIGSAWYKVSENGTEYITLSINPELCPLQLTEKHCITLFTIAEESRKTESSPNYRVVLSKKS